MSKDKIFESLRRLAVLKGVEATKERLQIYSELLVKYDYEEVSAAMVTLAKASRFFPDISDFMKILEPVASDDDQAKELAGAIVEAISRYGYCNELEAMAFIGDLGQLVVDRCGGWSVICKTTIDDLGTLRAQVRDTAKSAMISARAMPTENMLEYQKETKRMGGRKLEKITFDVDTEKDGTLKE